MFEGRVRVDRKWDRLTTYRYPASGYCGKPIPRSQGGLQSERMLSEKVVRQWVRSLKAEGRAIEVIEENNYITVRGKRRVESIFGQVAEITEEEWQMRWQEEQDDVIVTEPIVAKRDCKLEIVSAEPTEWIVKEAGKGGAPGYAGETYQALKLTLTITDPDVQTEHENARPRLMLEHQFNIDKYPYFDKKSGTVKWLGRATLYELEEAFGFEPIFTNGDGQSVEAYVTRTGRKVAPKGEGIKRSLNPAFLLAYFTPEGAPNLEWAGKTVFADVTVEDNEQFGARNRIQRFKRAPQFGATSL